MSSEHLNSCPQTVLTVLTHLSCAPVHQVEDSAVLRLPGQDVVKALALYLVQHELQQVQLDGLLNEHNVVLRHD